MREIHFLLDHKVPFINHICNCYPFSEDFIQMNSNNLNWDFLSINEKLPWTVSFIEKFQDSWNWHSLGENESLPWSDELITRFANRWAVDEEHGGWCLIRNNSIKWTKNIISGFPEKFPGYWLSQNTELLNNHHELLEEFKETLWWDYVSGNEYMNWSEQLIDRFINYWNWEILSVNEAIDWTPELKEKYKEKYNPKYSKYGYPEMWIKKRYTKTNTLNNTKADDLKTLYTEEEMRIRLKLIPYSRLSFDERVPWNEELLLKYEHVWDWGNLSLNKSLPWSEKLIDKFLDKWDFGTRDENNENAYTIGLSSNPGLPWSLQLIKKYETRWDWLCLTYSDNIPWSMEILEAFEDKWDWDQIIWNETMWKKVFYPSFDEEIIGALLTIVNKKVYPF